MDGCGHGCGYGGGGGGGGGCGAPSQPKPRCSCTAVAAGSSLQPKPQGSCAGMAAGSPSQPKPQRSCAAVAAGSPSQPKPRCPCAAVAAGSEDWAPGSPAMASRGGWPETDAAHSHERFKFSCSHLTATFRLVESETKCQPFQFEGLSDAVQRRASVIFVRSSLPIDIDMRLCVIC